MDLGLLILREVVGLTLAAHGAQKLFGWFGGGGIKGTGAFMAQLGMHPPELHSTAAGVAEFGGGLLLALGFLTPLGSLLVIGVMAVAIGTVHIDKGFFNSNGGFEYPVVLAASALSLAFSGPGRYSLDSALRINDSGLGWGFGVLVVALIGAGVTLLMRRPHGGERTA